MSLLNNITMAAGTAINHLAEDPVVLTLQISRRLPTSVVASTSRLVTRAFPQSTAFPALLATYVSGDVQRLEDNLAFALTADLSSTRARQIADVALAAGLPEWADKFLPHAVSAKRYPATLARRKWYDGDMAGAVTAVTGQRGAMGKQYRRLAGEQRTFSGWSPVLAPLAMEPVAGRVLHLLTNSLPHTGSGYSHRSHSILLAQQEAGREVLAITRLGYPVQVGKIMAAREDIVDGVRYRRLIPAKLAPTPDTRLQQEAEELLKVALEFRPEVLHTTTHFTNGLVAGAVAAALGIPWVYEVRGQLADTWASTRNEEAKTSERYLKFQASEANVLQEADAVVTLGAAMHDNLVARGVPPEKIVLAPNAVGGAFLKQPGTPRAAREKLGLNPALSYIGTVSSLVDYEGFDDLIDAFAVLAPNFPNLRLLLVGSGVAAPALQDRAAKRGLFERVIFTGRVHRDLTSLYHQAMDIFIVPRKDLDVTRAVTPMKPVEALASARPVIASDLSALREIVSDGVNGRLTPPGDPVGLANTVASLLLDECMMKELGIKGRELVLETRTWAINASAYAERYNQLRGEYDNRGN